MTVTAPPVGVGPLGLGPLAPLTLDGGLGALPVAPAHAGLVPPSHLPTPITPPGRQDGSGEPTTVGVRRVVPPAGLAPPLAWLAPADRRGGAVPPVCRRASVDRAATLLVPLVPAPVSRCAPRERLWPPLECLARWMSPVRCGCGACWRPPTAWACPGLPPPALAPSLVAPSPLRPLRSREVLARPPRLAPPLAGEPPNLLPCPRPIVRRRTTRWSWSDPLDPPPHRLGVTAPPARCPSPFPSPCPTPLPYRPPRPPCPDPWSCRHPSCPHWCPPGRGCWAGSHTAGLWPSPPPRSPPPPPRRAALARPPPRGRWPQPPDSLPFAALQLSGLPPRSGRSASPAGSGFSVGIDLAWCRAVRQSAAASVPASRRAGGLPALSARPVLAPPPLPPSPLLRAATCRTGPAPPRCR